MVGKDHAGLVGWNSRESNLTVSFRLDFAEPATLGSLPVQSGGSRAADGNEPGEDRDSDNVKRDLYVL
jgi:hypothetical protein